MKKVLLTAGLCSLFTFSAQSETEFQLSCPGRAAMTISRAHYGLTTLMWPQHYFQVASGQIKHTLEDGSKVTLTRFRNGDRLIINQSSGEAWFAAHGSNELTPCSRSAKRDVEAVTLERYDARAHIDS